MQIRIAITACAASSLLFVSAGLAQVPTDNGVARPLQSKETQVETGTADDQNNYQKPVRNPVTQVEHGGTNNQFDRGQPASPTADVQ